MTNEIIQAIREEIARLQPNAPKPGNMKSVDAKVAMQVHARLNKLLSFISYLEKSLPAKVADDDDKVLEVEAVSYCFDNGLNISPRGAADFARHFYDLGCRRTAEKYDEIEYNRQRASGSSEIPNDLAAVAIGIADSLLAKPKDYALSAKGDYWNGAHDGVIAGAKWHADHAPLHEDTVLFNKGVAEGRRLESEENKVRDIVFWRGIQYAREQMTEEAVEGEVCILPGGVAYVREQHNEALKQYILDNFKTGDKVRIIIVKEGEK